MGWELPPGDSLITGYLIYNSLTEGGPYTQVNNEPTQHAFYRNEPDLAELSDMNYDNPAVLEYFVAAHSKWIDEGASAIRVDTIKHMPHEFWKAFSDRIRERREERREAEKDNEKENKSSLFRGGLFRQRGGRDGDGT